MKFFTRGWAHGDMTDEEAEAVAHAYQRHLDALDLPQPVRVLASLNPHDGYILDVEHEASTGALCLRLRCGDLQVGYFDAVLKFSSVKIPPAHLAQLVEARRPACFEILYYEIDRADGDAFEYRILLSPVFEIAFRFREVAVIRQPVADRRTP